MESFQLEDMTVIFDDAGRDDWRKFSYPVWYGIPVKIHWRDYRYDFNLRGGWKRITGRLSVWPEPQEVLRRTDGNDLMYYGTDGYRSVYDLLNCYYVPFNEAYAFDVFPDNPLKSDHVRQALLAFDGVVREAGRIARTAPGSRAGDFLERVAANDRRALAEEAATLHRIIGGNLPILPPETIDVDYEVIPLIVAEGCTHHCDFCHFRTGGSFRARNLRTIGVQIRALKDFYGDDLLNYNALVLGQNNALAAGEDILLAAAEMAYDILDLRASCHQGQPRLFLFGSVDVFLEAGNSLFNRLERLPYLSSINLGLESPDQETLDRLGKPLLAEQVRDALQKMGEINRSYQNVTVNGNFVLGQDLPSRHVETVKAILSQASRSDDRGIIYLSPLLGASQRRQIIAEVREIKRAARVPVFLYFAQRL